MKFKATTVTNLLRGENGGYYLRARIRGKLIWRSLDTETFSVAKLRLPDKLAELRGTSPTEVELTPKITFEEAMELYKIEVNANTRLKPAAKVFRLRFEMPLRRTWPELFTMELRRVTPEACKAWLHRFETGASKFVSPRATKGRAGNSPTTINSLIAFLRRIFEIGVKAGLLYRNPALVLDRKPPTRKLLRLPNRSKFAAVVAHIRNQPGWGPASSDLVEGLAYSGARVGELKRLCWRDVDFEKGMLTIPGEKTENAPRIVPMTEDFRQLMVRLSDAGTPANDEAIFRVRTALVSLASGCRAIGVSHMTHHDLRHLFATTCIESGVDIPTVSNWLGHADGGALAMRTYGHIRPEHSIEAVKKVSFAAPAAKSILKLGSEKDKSALTGTER
jgi:integrase